MPLELVKSAPPPLTRQDISEAIAEDRVALCFQPVVLAKHNGFTAFHEGLIRIIDKNGLIRVAGEFISLCEGYDIGNFIDQVALELAVERLQQDKTARVSINMSTRTIWDEDWMFILADAGKRYPGILNRLIVEFTESSVLGEPDRTLAFMDYCRKFGVCFAVDDFGAGNTVIGHLRDYRFDILKIDGSICQDLGENRDNQVVLEAVVSIAKHFDMMTVAEFIDNRAAADKARDIGVDALQGFLFGKGEIFSLQSPLKNSGGKRPA